MSQKIKNDESLFNVNCSFAFPFVDWKPKKDLRIKKRETVLQKKIYKMLETKVIKTTSTK